MSAIRTTQSEVHRQRLIRWWPKRGNAWDAIQALDRAMLDAVHAAPTAEIERWMRAAYGCLEGARELMSIAAAAAEREARNP